MVCVWLVLFRPWEEEGPLLSSKRTIIGAEQQIKMNANNNNNNNNKDNNNNNTNNSSVNYKSTSNTINALSVGGVRMKKVKKRRKVRDPRFCFKTMSEVDVLDDGYKWRKYGQKVVKNTQHPRSYYRCSQDNCRVKKRVERSADDPRMVITTYEGRHVHSPSHEDVDQAQAASQLFGGIFCLISPLRSNGYSV
ncbi:putative WRKY transcription factor 13 [Ananas comosus]|uniref:Putative WRKY transcription factor 13 n=1 Tax=Ananas comosus TaxID=4615 RepID=A0A199UXG9_ANACO|nr:putative WRKY transcription factor 13 [Ananas comosus]